MNDYDYDFKWDERYCYPNSNVLINKLGVMLPLRLAYYLSEINVIHPFREGNGRAQRLFIEYLAGQNGYMVDFSTVSNTEMIEACALAFGRNYDLMNQLMQRITARTI